MEDGVKDILENDALIDDLRENLENIERFEDRIEYLIDLKKAIDELAKEELGMWGEMFG